MQLGMVGLGRMGGNMVRRLLRGGHQCVAYAQDAGSVRQLASEGAIGASSLEEFVSRLSRPRAAWVMVPAGDPTEQVVTTLARLMEAGDTIIDGGNSFYKDDVRRSKAESPKASRKSRVEESKSKNLFDPSNCSTF